MLQKAEIVFHLQAYIDQRRVFAPTLVIAENRPSGIINQYIINL